MYLGSRHAGNGVGWIEVAWTLMRRTRHPTRILVPAQWGVALLLRERDQKPELFDGELTKRTKWKASRARLLGAGRAFEPPA